MTHTDYQNQARQFLNNCSATMSIVHVGKTKPTWDNRNHDMYTWIIKTPRGQMTGNYYDSIHNTEINNMTLGEYIEKRFKCRAADASYTMKATADKELKAKKAEAKPTEYDILSCLEKYDVGSMDDFISEFGYEVKCVEDMTNIITTYNNVVKEYHDICRCFTQEQIEAMREIQ